MNTPSTPSAGWIEEFDKEFVPILSAWANVREKHWRESVPNNELKSFITSLIESERAEAREEAIRECIGVVEESKWQCPEHGEPPFKKTECLECNDSLNINVCICSVLESLTNLLTHK